MKKRYAALLCAAVITSVLMVQAPAAWLAPLVKHYSQGRVSLGQSWGTAWQGRAKVRIHRSDKEVLDIPEPLAWRLDLSQWYTLSARAQLISPALTNPVEISLHRQQLAIGAGQYGLAADGLNTLGAPFNTLKPTGELSLSWPSFEMQTQSQTPPAVALKVHIKQLRMALTGSDVLGDYVIDAKPLANHRWAVSLATQNPAQAALLLTGTGSLGLSGSPQFNLESKASNPQAQQRVQTLLNFLGRRQGDAYVLSIN